MEPLQAVVGIDGILQHVRQSLNEAWTRDVHDKVRRDEDVNGRIRLRGGTSPDQPGGFDDDLS